jgi:hypothetical protein
MAKKTTQKQGICIFCKGTKLSKQHIWADWLKKVIPRTGANYTQLSTHHHLVAPKHVLLQPILKIKNGDIGSQKIRNVCIKCNNEWMSKIETEAQKSLTSLIMGETIELDYATKLNISKWIVLTCIMAEYTDLSTKSISAQNRLYLYEEKLPPNNWRIYIGKYEGNEWKQRYRHHGIVAVLEEDLYKKNRPNMQFSTIVWGALFIHAISIPESMNLNDYLFPNSFKKKLRSIWPIKNDTLKSDSEIISDIEAIEIADYFSIKSIRYMP